MPKIRAALLSAPAASGEGLYLRIDELDSYGALTPCHLPAVTECDLPPGRYYWVPSEKDILGKPNPWGGAFWPLGMEPLDKHYSPAAIQAALDKAFQTIKEKYR